MTTRKQPSGGTLAPRIEDPSDACRVFAQTCNAGDDDGLVALYATRLTLSSSRGQALCARARMLCTPTSRRCSLSDR